MSELRKLVNDGFNKFKIYEEGKKALDEIDSLNQAKSDITKDVNDLAKKKEKLLDETTKLDGKIKEAEEKALFVVKTAEAKAETILSAVDDAVKDIQSKADKKLKETTGRIVQQEKLEDDATKKAIDAQSKLDAINFELQNATAKFKALVG